MLKRFAIGFVLGLLLMRYYLHYGEEMKSDTWAWFGKAASNYRDDKQHKAAREALGESEQRR